MSSVDVSRDPGDREAWRRAGYSELLVNEDLAPAKERRWGTWSIACMWMSDVHSARRSVTARPTRPTPGGSR